MELVIGPTVYWDPSVTGGQGTSDLSRLAETVARPLGSLPVDRLMRKIQP
jgi:hypothetical protein